MEGSTHLFGYVLAHAATIAKLCYSIKQHFASNKLQTNTMENLSVNDLLAHNLRRLMASRRLTQAGLAKLSQIGQTTVSLYLSPDRRQPSKTGKVPSAKLTEVESLALALEVEVWELLAPESRSLTYDSGKVGELRRIADGATSAANDDELVEIRKAAIKIVGGDPVVAIDHSGPDFNGVIYLAKSWLIARGLARDKVFAAAVKGDSMAPRIQEGDLLLINQGDTTKRSGHVYGLSHDGKFMVKRLKKDGRHWCLMSDNPEHPPITADENTKVIGRVVLMKTEQI